MPLDSYFATNTDSRIESQAERILTSTCMAQGGYDWPVPYSELEWPDDPVFTATGIRRFSHAIAAEYGYGYADVPDPSSDALREASDAINEMMTPEMDTESTKCGRWTNETLDYGDVQVANNFWIEVSDKVRESDRVRESRKKWGECLAKAGIPDLPASPDDMPTTWMNQRFLEDSEKTGKARSPLEIEWAVSDAKCRGSSGYTQALYDEMWDGQVEVVRSHLDELERARSAIEENREKAMKVINEYDGEAAP